MTTASWFSRTPDVESPSSRTEVLFRQMGQDFYNSLSGISGDFLTVVQRESRAHGVDPLYVLHVMFDKQNRWNRLLGKHWMAMNLVVKVAEDWATLPDITPMQIPVDQGEVDAVLLAVGKWADTEWKQKVMRLYLGAAKKYLRDADFYIKEKYEQQWPKKKVLCWMYGQMQNLTRRKTRLWPKYGVLLDQMANIWLQRDTDTTCPI